MFKNPGLRLPKQIRKKLARRGTTDLLLSGLNHPYAYVSANPLLYIDPFGLAPDCKYYDIRCNEDAGPYYCDVAPELCENWPDWMRPPGGDDEWVDCVRDCLQRKDWQCDPTPGQCSDEGIDASCNIRIHRECWIDCF